MLTERSQEVPSPGGRTPTRLSRVDPQAGLLHQARIDVGNIHGQGNVQRMVLESYNLRTGERVFDLHLPFSFP